MSYKRRLKVTDIVLDFREQILTAHEKQDKDTLAHLGNVFDHLCERAYKARDRNLAGLLEDMVYTTSHFIMGVEFKAFDALPSPEAIMSLEHSASNFDQINARLVHRALVMNKNHPELGYIPDETGEYIKIEPDWVGIAIVNGPYSNTFDLLCYKFDGNLISSHDFDKKEKAYKYTEEKLEIQTTEWENCDIDIQNEGSHVIWKQNG